jgi:cardiolipin synthase A/B
MLTRPGSSVHHWGGALRTVGIPALMATLVSCASPPPGPEESSLVGRVPDLAVAVDDTLYVRYPGNGASVVLSAQWPADDAGAPASTYRAARLEVHTAPIDLDTLARTGRPVTLLSQSEWDALLQQLLTDLAPAAPDEAALAVVQGNDVVFARTRAGLQIHRHETKPPSLRVTRVVTEDELSRKVSGLLAERHGRGALVLFDTGSGATGRSLVLVDIARGQSVLITPASAPASLAAPADAGLALSLTDAVVIRSHVITPLTQPVTAAARLTWLTMQTAVGLVPKPRPAPTAPMKAAGQGAAMDLDEFERTLDTLVGARRTQARLTLLIDGDTYFPKLVQAIQDARESVLVRLYIFDTDPFSLQLADLLKERSKTIRVQVLLDNLGTLAAARAPARLPYAGATAPKAPHSIVDYLQADSKVHVRTLANPWMTSDHTKTIIVDSGRVFLGGMNIGQEYRYEWHDLMVEVEGPVATHLARDFESAWSQAALGGDLARLSQLLEPRADAGATPTGAVEMRTLYTRTGNPEILAAQLAAIRSARSYIYVQQPYMSDDEIIAALVDARRGGVDVRVVLPTAGDSGFMNAANLIATNVFLRNGVRVYAYPGMTHVKAAIYDGWACLGSANFDKLSLRINRELDIATSDPVFVGQLRRDLFERDFARSKEITEPRSVGWSTYLSSFIANQL